LPSFFTHIDLGHAFGIAEALGRGIEAVGEHIQGLELLFAEELVRSNWAAWLGLSLGGAGTM